MNELHHTPLSSNEPQFVNEDYNNELQPQIEQHRAKIHDIPSQLKFLNNRYNELRKADANLANTNINALVAIFQMFFPEYELHARSNEELVARIIYLLRKGAPSKYVEILTKLLPIIARAFKKGILPDIVPNIKYMIEIANNDPRNMYQTNSVIGALINRTLAPITSKKYRPNKTLTKLYKECDDKAN